MGKPAEKHLQAARNIAWRMEYSPENMQVTLVELRRVLKKYSDTAHIPDQPYFTAQFMSSYRGSREAFGEFLKLLRV